MLALVAGARLVDDSDTERSRNNPNTICPAFECVFAVCVGSTWSESMHWAHKIHDVRTACRDASSMRRRSLGFPVLAVCVCVCVPLRKPRSGGRGHAVATATALPISGHRSTEICLLSHIINEFIVFVRTRARVACFCIGLVGMSLYALWSAPHTRGVSHYNCLFMFYASRLRGRLTNCTSNACGPIMYLHIFIICIYTRNC